MHKLENGAGGAVVGKYPVALPLQAQPDGGGLVEAADLLGAVGGIAHFVAQDIAQVGEDGYLLCARSTALAYHQAAVAIGRYAFDLSGDGTVAADFLVREGYIIRSGAGGVVAGAGEGEFAAGRCTGVKAVGIADCHYPDIVAGPAGGQGIAYLRFARAGDEMKADEEGPQPNAQNGGGSG